MKNLIKQIGLLLIVLLIGSTLNFQQGIAATSGTLLTVERAPSTSTVKVGSAFDVNYRVTPKPITTPVDNKPKEIILVIDVSTSMLWGLNNSSTVDYKDSRLASVKQVATDFVNKFNDKNITLALVKFHGYATDVLGFTSLDTATNRKKVTDVIGALNTQYSNGTNIGDGMRTAYYDFDYTKNSDKYIIVLTDGDTNYYSANSYGYYVGAGTYDYHYNVYGKNGDPNDNSLIYARDYIAPKVDSAAKLNSYIIGFGPEATSRNMAIATAAGGTYQIASNQTALNNLYSSFYTSINNPTATVYFEETIPQGLEVVTPLPNGLMISNGKITGNLTVTYHRNPENNTQYIADPMNLTITYKASVPGTSVNNPNPSQVSFPPNQGFVRITPGNFNMPEETLRFDRDTTVSVTASSSINIVPDNVLPTNSDINVNITYDSNARTREYRVNGGTWRTYTGAVVFTSNGSIEARSTDSWNRSYSAGPVYINNIDKTKLTATISYSPNTLTSGNVVATIKPNKDTAIITNNGGLRTKTFTGNGSFTFEFKDNLGNTGTAVATVDFIDKLAPVGTVTYSETKATNQDVVATLEIADDSMTEVTNNGKKYTKAFTENGTFRFEFKDAAGNTGYVDAVVTNIDKDKPTATFQYTPDGKTNQNVTARLIPNESVTIVNNTGLDTYTFTDSGKFKFQFRDAAGNDGEAEATVSIDRQAPTASISLSNTNPTNSYVDATLVDPSEPITVTNNGGSLKHRFTANGRFTFEFVDEAGNTGSKAVTVTNIDLTPPTASISLSNTNPTNKNVEATLVNPSEPITVTNNGGKLKYTFTKNGTFTFTFKDDAGNMGSQTVTVGNIKEISITSTVSPVIIRQNSTKAFKITIKNAIDTATAITVSLAGKTNLIESLTPSAGGKYTIKAKSTVAGLNQVWIRVTLNADPAVTVDIPIQILPYGKN